MKKRALYYNIDENKHPKVKCQERIIMTLKNMLKMTTVDAVLEELLIAYPECQSDKNKYKSVIEYVMKTPEVPFEEFIISIELIDPSEDEAYEDEIDEAAYLSISGCSAKEDLHFALGFTRWEEWANAKIVLQEELEIKQEELIAICIYEMTFYGFDQDEIASELAEIEKGIMMH